MTRPTSYPVPRKNSASPVSITYILTRRRSAEVSKGSGPRLMIVLIARGRGAAGHVHVELLRVTCDGDEHETA